LKVGNSLLNVECSKKRGPENMNCYDKINDILSSNACPEVPRCLSGLSASGSIGISFRNIR
jgi:hypothetical protein